MKIDGPEIKAVIFDLDGTLYDQGGLRRRMFVELMAYYFIHPLRLKELKILYDFRRQREKVNDFNTGIEEDQYIRAAKISLVSPDRVRDVVKRWILDAPLKYLKDYLCQWVPEFFDDLKSRGIKIAIFSDYPAASKLSALGISCPNVFCSTDKDIDALKPDPKGLFVISGKMGVPVENCLFIGDRDDRDGECARRAGMKYLTIKSSDGPTGLAT